MTPRQLAALDFIKAYHAERRLMPSFHEIASGLNLKSRTSVHRLMQGLVERGELVRTKGHARSYALPHHRLTNIPTSDLIAELRQRGVSHG